MPADWVHQPVRCKHCKQIIQVKRKPLEGKRTDPMAPVLTTPPPPLLPAAAPEPGELTAYDVGGAGDENGLLPPIVETEAAPFRMPTRQRSKGGWAFLAVLGGVVLSLAAVAGTALYLTGSSLLPELLHPKPAVKGPDDAGEHHGPNDPIPAAGDFPRRLLAVSVNGYLYANPINYGSQEGPAPKAGKGTSSYPGHNLHSLVERLARALHVPPSQVLELSDAAPGPLARPPLKPVIEQTVHRFLETSRPQDRVLLLFVGHAVEIEKVPYLAPLEGELDRKETLIPLAWLLGQLDECKARQKVLILDVCRYDPGRGLERPGSGEMGEHLDKALKHPPAGVQVWTACVVGQRSYEFDNAWLNNGVFLEELLKAVGHDQRFKINLGLQSPPDPLPLDKLVPMVNSRTEKEVANDQKEKQTPRQSGEEKPGGASYEPHEPLPNRLEIPTPPPPGGAAAPLDVVRAILRETVEAIPPVKIARDGSDRLKAESLPPFSAKLLEAYRPDYASLGELEKRIAADPAKYPLHKAVLHAADLLKSQTDKKATFTLELRSNTPAVKKAILENQRNPARIIFELKEALDELKEAGKDRAKEPSPRWQANYDYVLARVAARLAYYFEYNLMLGKVRKDELPELGAVHKGWRLASREKLNTKEAKEYASEARKALDRLAKQHKGTPWEVLAKRERLTSLGLEWQATSFGE
jgi:hypothetical protein